MKRANPKKKNRKENRDKRDKAVEQEFWNTYELFVTAMIYDIIMVENFSMDKASDIMEGIGALIEEVHDRRMTLDEFKEWVGEETGIDIKGVFTWE